MPKSGSKINFEEVLDDLTTLLDKDQLDFVRNILTDMHPADISDLMEHISPEARTKIFRLLSPEVASEVLVELGDAPKEDLLDELGADQIAKMVNEMDSDDAAAVVAELSEEKATRVLEGVEAENSEDIQELLHYPEDTAGGIMAKEYLVVRADDTVAEATDELRRQHENVDQVFNCYVVDKENRLVGAVSLKDLLLNPADKLMSEIMDREVISIPSDLDQEKVANIFQKYDLVAAPVVDANHRLIGRITIDDILDVIDEETDEDLAHIAGTGEEEILEESIFKISRARLPWLILSFVGEIVSAFILEHFSSTINQVVVSAFFIPIVMAMGGSSGQQSSIIVVRGLATGEIHLKDTRRRLWREFRSSLLNAIVIAALIFSVVSLWQHTPDFAGVLSGTLIVVILNASLFGAIIPIIFKKINVDPALATGPFVATFNDVFGLLIYFSLLTFSFHYFL